MKKVILLFALVFSVSSSFISCRDEADDREEQIEEVGEDIEDAGDEIEDELDDAE